MKVALVIERMDDFRGGRETSTAQIASLLARRGHDVAVLCRSGSWRAEGVEVAEVGRRGLGRAGQLSAFVADAGREAARRGFDVVHAMLPVPGADVYQMRGGTAPGQAAAAWRRWGRLAALRTLLEPLNRRRRRMARLEAEVAADARTFCLAVSEMAAEEFRRAHGRSDRLRVVYNAVEIPAVGSEERSRWRRERRERLGAGPEEPVFVTVATNPVLKGVPELIRAFAAWGGAGRLVVVGSERVGACRRLAGRCGLARRVEFVPPVRNVFEWYSAADACVLLSWYDPCSRVVLEAVRWGLPCVTTRYNGASEVLQGGAGLVVDSPADTAAVAAALDAMTDPVQRGRFAEACRAVGDGLGMERHVDRLLEIYREAAGR